EFLRAGSRPVRQTQEMKQEQVPPSPPSRNASPSYVQPTSSVPDKPAMTPRREMSPVQKVVPSNPEMPGDFVERGIVFLQKGNLSAAISDFTEAINLEPQYADAYIQRGIAYQRRSDAINAMLDFKRAMQIAPQHPDALMVRDYMQKLNLPGWEEYED